MQSNPSLRELTVHSSVLQRVLIRRGLRFTFWRFPRMLLSGPRRVLVWALVWNLLSDFAFWLILFAWFGILEMPKALLDSSFLALLQAISPLFSVLIAQVIARARRHQPGFIIESELDGLRSVSQTEIASRPNLLSARFFYQLVKRLQRPVTVLGSWLYGYVTDIGVLLLALLVVYRGTRGSVLDIWATSLLSLQVQVQDIWKSSQSKIFCGAFLAALAAFEFFLRRKPILRRVRLAVLVGASSIALALPIGLIGIALLNSNPSSILGLALVLESVNSILSIPLAIVSWFVVSGLLTGLSVLPNLMRIRASILVLIIFAGTITFLNQDSWQLATGLEWWPEMAAIAGLVYFLPIALLVFSHRQLIRHELYEQGWKPDEELDLPSLFEGCQAVGIECDNMTRGCIGAALEVACVPKLDAVVIVVKNMIKLVLFLALVPGLAFIFFLFLFHLMINDTVLSFWLQGLPFPQPASVLGTPIDSLMLLRIKAAAILAILSAGSTLATSLASGDKMQEFIAYAFSRDIHQDKCLLTLHHTLQLAASSHHEELQ